MGRAQHTTETGGTGSKKIEEIFNNKFVSKAVVETSPRKTFFTGRGSNEGIPKNQGDSITKMVNHSALESTNMTDAGLDASTATIQKNTWYQLDTNGVVVGMFQAVDYMSNGETIEEAIALAKAALAADMNGSALADATAVNAYLETQINLGLVKSGARIEGGDAAFSIMDNLAPLPETGGVSLLKLASSFITAKVSMHAIGITYTKRSVDTGVQANQIGRIIKEVAKSKTQLQELQVQNSILDQAENNSMVASEIAGTKEGITPFDVADYDSFVAFEQSLLNDEVPLDTEMLTGVDRVDTKTVEDAYICYCTREAKPALLKMKGPDGTGVWISKAKYGAKGMDPLPGEIGTIDGLPFRFVVVPDLQKYVGVGKPIVVADNATAAATAGQDEDGVDITKAAYDALGSKTHSANGNVTVFPFLVIGEDSFITTSIEGQNTKANHIMPTPSVIAGVNGASNDMTGENGGVACKWSYGFLCYRPERIAMLLSALPRV